MYPLKCSDTINSFIWNLLGFEGLNCKNLTHPLKTIVDSSKEMYSDGVYQRQKFNWHISRRGRTLAKGSWFSDPGGGLFFASTT